MPKETDILIVGAGVIGSACAWFLSHLSCKVTLLEQSRIGNAGATSISRGLLRVYEPERRLADWAKSGLQFYMNWPVGLGSPISQHVGLLYRLKDENLEYALSFSDSYSSKLYPILIERFANLKSKFSELKWASRDWVVYEPSGGFGDPMLTAQRFSYGSEKNGVSIFENQKVSNIKKKYDGTWLVESDSGAWIAKKLVLTMGAWTADWFPNIGISTRSIAIPIFQSKGIPQYPVIDEIAQTYVRPIAKNTAICGSQVFEYCHHSSIPGNHASSAQVSDSLSRIELLFNDAKPNESQEKTLGFDGYTKDFLPVLNFEDTEDNLVVLSGFSGRGYKLAPAIGMLCRDHFEAIFR